jgi:ABC-2 type transport system permease protein
VSRRTAQQVYELGRRSLVRTLRQPAQFAPTLIFPMFLLAVNSGGLDAATNIPGFPTDSYLTFALAVPFLQGGIFGLMNGGTDMARDIESGFLKRLSLTPMSGTALIAGELTGVVAAGLLQGVVYLSVGLAAGAHFEAGAGGVLVLLALAVAIAFAFGCLGIFVALRTGNSEAVQGMFPLFFVLLFLSSMALPRNLIEQDWFRTVATWNPVSYLIEGVRSLFIDGFNGEALGLAFGVAAAIAAIGLAASAASLRRELVRT